MVIVTAQALLILYYDSAAWVTSLIAKVRTKRVESMHYQSVRLIIKDYRQRVYRKIIDMVTKRLPANLWAKYAGRNVVMNLKMLRQPVRLLYEMRKNLYPKKRKEGQLFS